MSFKEKVQHILGNIQCKRYSIRLHKGEKVYIGQNSNIVNGNKISLGNLVCIRKNVSLWSGGKGITIGSGTEIGERCRISIMNELSIGEKVLISPNVYITDCDHAYEAVGIPILEQGVVRKNNHVNIKDHAFVGINSVIIGDVTIGKGSVIGANSVVTKSIPDYCVAVGTPARVIKRYNAVKGIWESV